ncbi:MAG: hypothetical protein AAF871_02045 [Pseudomonadota bacterium]
MKRIDARCCGRGPSNKESSIDGAGYDGIETAILEVARFYWQTFAMPETQSWLMAHHRSEVRFGQEMGGLLGLDILSAVQAMRMARTSCFKFNNPGCPHCAEIVSEHERQFMNVLQSIRAKRMGATITHAMLLCEGNDASAFIQRMAEVAERAFRDPGIGMALRAHPQIAIGPDMA